MEWRLVREPGRTVCPLCGPSPFPAPRSRPGPSPPGGTAGQSRRRPGERASAGNSPARGRRARPGTLPRLPGACRAVARHVRAGSRRHRQPSLAPLAGLPSADQGRQRGVPGKARNGTHVQDGDALGPQARVVPGTCAAASRGQDRRKPPPRSGSRQSRESITNVRFRRRPLCRPRWSGATCLIGQMARSSSLWCPRYPPGPARSHADPCMRPGRLSL